MTILGISTGLVYIIIFHLLTVIKVTLIAFVAIITLKIVLILGIKK